MTLTAAPPGASFRQHLAQKLKDPSFRACYQQEVAKLELALMIAEARKREGLSQVELAQRMGTTQSSVARLESSSYGGYSLETLLRVASALGVTLELKFRRHSARSYHLHLPRKWISPKRQAA